MDKIYYELTISAYKDVEKLPFNKWQKIKGIQTKENSTFCYRCGEQTLIQYNGLLYCNNCLEFGKVTKETYFYKLPLTPRTFQYVDELIKIKFTPRQLLASKFILSNIIFQSDCLIHAVCGAGKTEITFQAIAYILQKNQYICFAIPRIDILYEIYDRLKIYFPKTKICILNSNEDKIQHGQIYVMTTNQIIKFKNAFSLIIVDEIDAFPYEYNSKYDYGVQNAKTKKASVVYLTSTPSQNFLQKQMNTYQINRRWHGYRLPVPKLKYWDLGEFLKNGDNQFLKRIRSYEKTSDNRQLLIFISTIKLGKEVQQKLSQFKIDIPFVNSKSKTRREDIKKFSELKIKIMLTTTILERGVTFKNIDLIVLDSTSNMYNKAALIQIAGRVGRNINYQEGVVYFYYKHITRTIKESIAEIKRLNK